MDAEEIPEKVASPPLLEPCRCCGRTFVHETLVKHQKICEKNSSKKRKVFDTSKQRLNELGVENIEKSTSKVPPSKKNNWRQKHEEFIDAMRSAREVSHALKTGAPLPPPISQKPKVNPDYVQCPSCSRHFNENAAERHIPWCKEKSKRIGGNVPSENKKQQLNTRTKYKPPLPGTKKLKSPNPRSTVRRTAGKSTSLTSPSTGGSDLEEKFSESMTIGRRKSGSDRQNRVNSRNVRSSSLERPIGNRRQAPRNSSGDSLRRRNYSEDEYDDSTGDENNPDVTPSLTNGYISRNNHVLPHQKIKSATSDRSSPLTGRTPTPPLSRKSSLESIGRRPSKFCYECGTKYPVPHAKYCCECGTKRPYIE